MKLITINLPQLSVFLYFQGIVCDICKAFLSKTKHNEKSVSIKCRLQTADCRLQTGYKMQTRYKMQTADCRLGIKCRLRPKLGINCRLRAKLSFRAVGDIFSSLTRPCRVIAFPSSFPRNFLSICIDCEQSMSTDRKGG